MEIFHPENISCRHGDEIGELAAHAIECPVDEREAGSGLSVEIVRDRFSVQIGEGCLPCEPDDLATLRDDGWRESARFLKIRAFQMDHGAVCCHWLKISRHVSRAEIKLTRSPHANNCAS